MSEPKPENPYWTPERREEHRVRGVAHDLCLKRDYIAAKTLMLEHKLEWPPFKKTPTGDEERNEGIRNSEKHKAAVRENGKSGGRKPGVPQGHKQMTLASPEDTEKLIENVANVVLSAGNTAAIKSSPMLGEVSGADRKALVRLVQIPVEEFNARLVEKLGILGDKIASKIEEKLDKDLFKTGELSFALIATLQQRANLDGRAALQNANISLQVNNFMGGTKTREEMIRSLNPTRPDEPINITPPAPPKP